MTVIAAIALIGFGAFVIVGNWVIVIRWFWTKKHVSRIPLIGGGAAALGSLLVMDWRAALIALVVDPGGVVWALLPLPFVLWRGRPRLH